MDADTTATHPLGAGDADADATPSANATDTTAS